MEKIKKNYVPVLEVSFKITYLLLCVSTFVGKSYDSPIQSVLVRLSLGLAFLVLIERLVHFRSYSITSLVVLLSLFLISFLLSSILNMQYGGLTGNIKWLVWMGIQFFLLFVTDKNKTKDSIKKEFYIIARVIVVLSFILAAISIGMMILQYGEVWYGTNREILISGANWGRLWGTYTDPNYGSVFCVMAIVLSFFFIKSQFCAGWKIFCGFNIFLNFQYISFAQSRTGILSLICCTLFFFMVAELSCKRRKRIILISILCVVIPLAGTTLVRTEYNTYLQPEFAKIFNQNKTTEPVKNKLKKMQRNTNTDITNGRAGIWKSGVEIWLTSPVVGTGYTSFIGYTKAHLPETYVVNNSEGDYVSMHNEFLNILVYQGIIGFVIFMAFLVNLIYIFLGKMWRPKRIDLEQIACLSCVGAVIISMMLLLEGIYLNSMGAFVLWTFLGYLVYGEQTEGEDEENA